MTPFRVLHVLGTAKAEGISIAATVISLARELDPAVFQLHAWFLAEDGPLVETLAAHGVRVRVLKWHLGIRDPWGGMQFRRALRREKFALVHQHFGGRSVRWLLRSSSRARIIAHLHGRVNESRGMTLGPATSNGADAVIAVSEAVARQVIGETVTVVPPGVPIVAGPPQLTKSILQNRDDLIIGAACRLVPVKGLEYLLVAVARLRIDHPGIRLEIAGSGPMREKLEHQARRLGLADCISFLGWRTDLSCLMPSWTAFVQSSLDEGFPVALMEAMSAGIPVVATSVGGTPELVDNGRTGILVPPSDPMALAAGLRTLIQDARLREKIGSAGRDRVRKQFSESRMVASIGKIYEKMLQPSG